MEKTPSYRKLKNVVITVSPEQEKKVEYLMKTVKEDSSSRKLKLPNT